MALRPVADSMGSVIRVAKKDGLMPVFFLSQVDSNRLSLFSVRWVSKPDAIIASSIGLACAIVEKHLLFAKIFCMSVKELDVCSFVMPIEDGSPRASGFVIPCVPKLVPPYLIVSTSFVYPNILRIDEEYLLAG